MSARSKLKGVGWGNVRRFLELLFGEMAVWGSVIRWCAGWVIRKRRRLVKRKKCCLIVGPVFGKAVVRGTLNKMAPSVESARFLCKGKVMFVKRWVGNVSIGRLMTTGRGGEVTRVWSAACRYSKVSFGYLIANLQKSDTFFLLCFQHSCMLHIMATETWLDRGQKLAEKQDYG